MKGVFPGNPIATFALVLQLAFVSAALACPNNCNFQGTCDSNDVCRCDTGQLGSDCSLTASVVGYFSSGKNCFEWMSDSANVYVKFTRADPNRYFGVIFNPGYDGMTSVCSGARARCTDPPPLSASRWVGYSHYLALAADVGRFSSTLTMFSFLWAMCAPCFIPSNCNGCLLCREHFGSSIWSGSSLRTASVGRPLSAPMSSLPKTAVLSPPSSRCRCVALFDTSPARMCTSTSPSSLYSNGIHSASVPAPLLHLTLSRFTFVLKALAAHGRALLLLKLVGLCIWTHPHRRCCPTHAPSFVDLFGPALSLF